MTILFEMRPKLGRLALALPLLILVAACAPQSSYQPAERPGDIGYSDSRIDDHTWRVAFVGNTTSSPDQVRNALLFRAAQIATAEKADGFVVLNETVVPDVRFEGTNLPPDSPILYNAPAFQSPRIYSGSNVIEPNRRLPPAGAFIPGAGRRPLAGRGALPAINLRPLRSYSGVATVRLYHGAPPTEGEDAYNAAEVLRDLQPLVAPETAGTSS